MHLFEYSIEIKRFKIFELSNEKISNCDILLSVGIF